jgi:hypothetical protein
MNLYTIKLDPVIQKKASKKAQHEGSNLAVVIRQFLIKYTKGEKEEK